MPTSTRGRSAQDVKGFYTGKTLRILVGLPPGGGADAYARASSQRHLGRHVPGSPGGRRAEHAGRRHAALGDGAQYQPEDGTVLAHFSSALLTEAITAPDKVKLDFRTFGWLGNVSEDVRVCYVRSATGIQNGRTWWRSALVVFGATAPGTAGNVDTAMLRNLFGIKLRQVQGYAGSADKRHRDRARQRSTAIAAALHPCPRIGCAKGGSRS